MILEIWNSIGLVKQLDKKLIFKVINTSMKNFLFTKLQFSEKYFKVESHTTLTVA